MAATTLLDFRRADSACERADRLEKQELVARQDLLISHSTLETFDSDPGLCTATEASDDESWGEWDGGPACGEWVHAGKGHAEPIFRPSTAFWNEGEEDEHDDSSDEAQDESEGESETQWSHRDDGEDRVDDDDGADDAVPATAESPANVEDSETPPDAERRLSSSSTSGADADEARDQMDSPRLDGNAVYCPDCQMWLNGPVQWQDHCIGKKHKTGKKHKSNARRARNRASRSGVDKAAARLMICEGRVANAKKELQNAEAWWRITSLRMKLKALQDAEGTELKIRPSKKETPIPASAPDAKTVARLGAAFGEIDDILKIYEIESTLDGRYRERSSTSKDESLEAASKPAQKRTKANVQAEAEAKATGKAMKTIDNMTRQIANLKRKLRTREVNDAFRDLAKRARYEKSKGKGKGQGKGKKGDGRGPAMPKELIGLDRNDENGEPYCFSANLSTCDKAEWGGKCPKGWHKCMKRGCDKLHAYVGNH